MNTATKMRRCLCAGIILLIILSLSDSYAQWRIHVSNGASYTGEILDEKNDSVYFKTFTNEKIVVPRTQILSQERVYSTKKDFIDDIGSVSANPLIKLPQLPPYLMIGVGIGSPVGIEGILGYGSQDVGIRLIGGAIDHQYGGEIQGLVTVYARNSTKHRFAVKLGYAQIPKRSSGYRETSSSVVGIGMTIDPFAYALSSLDPELRADYYRTYREWTYMGGEYEINWNGLFASLGLSYGYGNYASFQIMTRVGYMLEISL